MNDTELLWALVLLGALATVIIMDWAAEGRHEVCLRQAATANEYNACVKSAWPPPN